MVTLSVLPLKSSDGDCACPGPSITTETYGSHPSLRIEGVEIKKNFHFKAAKDNKVNLDKEWEEIE